MAAALRQKRKDHESKRDPNERLHRVVRAAHRALVLSDDESGFLGRICRTLVFVGGYRLAWLGFEKGGELHCSAKYSAGGFENFDPFLLLFPTVTGDAEENLLERVLHKGRWQVRRRPSQATSPDDPPSVALTAAAFPLRIREKVAGVLLVYGDDASGFDREERRLLSEIAQDIAFGIAVLRDKAGALAPVSRADGMVSVDPVTGVSSYTYFEAQLELDLAANPERFQQAALLVIGIHRLWEINDSFGLEQADVLLRHIAERLQQALPTDARVARMRGDEFAVFLATPVQAETEERLQSLVQILREPFTVESLEVEVHTTIGYSLYPSDGRAIGHLIRNAAVAMRRAKAEHEPVARYDSGHDEQGPQRLALAVDLRRALDADELRLHYQPKVEVASGRICGVEALVRWEHPKRGLIPPDEFISVAEQTGQIGAITEWVIRRSLKDATVWREAGLEVPVAVNLSPRDLKNEALPDKIAGLLQAAGAEGSWLELEITEGAVIDNPEGALRVLERLSDLGIALYIDDFGTGYSSLGYLKQLPADALKIDKSFIIDMLSDPDSAVIVRSLIGLAHHLGLKVVAEGVENEATWKELVGLGCDVVQGFYIGRPVSSGEFLQQTRQQ